MLLGILTNHQKLYHSGTDPGWLNGLNIISNLDPKVAYVVVAR